VAQNVEEDVAGVSERFRWLGKPKNFSVDEKSLKITSGPREDWFIDPETAEMTSNAPAYICEPSGDFTLQARVTPGFATTFDAGALVLWHDESNWAKLAFEYSPQGHAMVVSVVTRGESDDCNSVILDSESVWLRIARRGRAHAFHYSLDAQEWHFVRYFRLNENGAAAVGFEAQSPLGDGCTARFSDVAYSTTRLTDIRSGL
jgi:regulation of enolase protein 1 (concanavalin A-like superfamily)